MSLTVVQLLPALDSGGVERGTLEIGRALVEQGHRSVVISHGGRLVAQLEAEGSEHITLPVHRKSLTSLLRVRDLRGRIAALAPDVVHARSRVPAWLAWLALRRMAPTLRPAFVTTVHGLYSVNAYSEIMTRGDVVIAVSETARRYVVDNYRRCPPERIRVIHRGVDPREFPADFRPSGAWLADWRRQYPQLAGRRVITLPGRITRLKGHDAFIRLIAALVTAGESVHGLIVGGAEQRKQAYLDELRSDIEAAGLGDHISLTGLRADIREVFSQSDVIVSLSRQPESFGRTALEALALRVPVVGWSHGGVGEILGEMFPAGAVPPGDFEALLGCVRMVLAERPRVGAVPPAFMRARMCADTLDVYRDLAAKRRGADR